MDIKKQRRWLGVYLGLLSIFFYSCLVGCRGTTRPQQRLNVIIILIDALRADHLGCYRYPRSTSPVIDALASRSAVFDAAFANASWTKPSIPSLFTGRYPIQHQVFTGNTADPSGRITSDVLDARLQTLAEALKSAGYSTAAFLNNAQMRSFLGFDQGFDVYNEELRDAVNVTETFLRWLKSNHRYPFFAYVHYLDVHWPYRPPAAFAAVFSPPTNTTIDFNGSGWRLLQDQIRSGAVRLTDADRRAMLDLYDGGIRFTDASIGQLLATLRLLNLEQQTIVIITADHGEEFLEHGGVGHGYTLYDEVLRVPLILHIPGTKPLRISRRVQLVDVMPTVLDLAGVSLPRDLGGVSLRPLLSGKASIDETTFAEHRSKRWMQSIRFGHYKLIRSFVLPASEQHKHSTPPLYAGMWLKVKGLQREAGAFLALKVEQLEPEHGIRLRGQLTDIDANSRTFKVLGIACRVGPATVIQDENEKSIDKSAFADGTWWKVKGDFDRDAVLNVKEATIIRDPLSQEPEIKAKVEKVFQKEQSVRLRMVGLTLSFNSSTDFTGRWPTKTAEHETEKAPLRLSFTDLRKLRVLNAMELYDLSRDPYEKHNLAKELSDVVADLSRRIDAWENQFGPKGAGPQQKTLDEETLQRLRALGYIN